MSAYDIIVLALSQVSVHRWYHRWYASLTSIHADG